MGKGGICKGGWRCLPRRWCHTAAGAAGVGLRTAVREGEKDGSAIARRRCITVVQEGADMVGQRSHGAERR